jgi:hypothetical protein
MEPIDSAKLNSLYDVVLNKTGRLTNIKEPAFVLEKFVMKLTQRHILDKKIITTPG